MRSELPRAQYAIIPISAEAILMILGDSLSLFRIDLDVQIK